MPAGKRDRSVSQTRKLFAGVAALAMTSAGAFTTAGVAWADPAPSIPIDILQAPGLPAMQQLSPVLQQAAANPQNAASMLMAAASAFAGNSAAPADSRQVASSVNQFVQQPPTPGTSTPGFSIKLPNNFTMPGNLNQLFPAAPNSVAPAGPPSAATPALHVPAAGVVPGAEPHLPTGVDPAHVVGPAPGEALAPAPGAAPDSTPVAARAPDAPAPAAAPAPETSAPAPPDAAPAAPDAAPPAFGPDAPPTQEFMYPSIGNGCLANGGNVIATAISVAGPAPIPKPGPKPGQTAYVFTAIGTPGPAAEQKLPMNVTWVNLTTGKSGSATLKPNPQINPDGPATLVAIADTGSGSIMSTIFGQLTTVDRQCTFLPTIGSTVVP
jgi:hypothetical protein